MPAIPPSVRGAVITGWGTALPPKVLTNHDLEKTLDTNDEWIVERTGIRERHVGGTTVGLSVESGRMALAAAGLEPGQIDALVLSTTPPDRLVPASSAAVQRELGLSCGAFDVNAACSGFVYALVQAHGMIAMGAKKVLCIGTDTLARITDWSDRNTAVLFADGSGAVVLEAVEGPGQLLGWDLDADRFVHLTYLFGSVTPKVPALTVQGEVLRALNEWAKVTNLTFQRPIVGDILTIPEAFQLPTTADGLAELALKRKIEIGDPAGLNTGRLVIIDQRVTDEVIVLELR